MFNLCNLKTKKNYIPIIYKTIMIKILNNKNKHEIQTFKKQI